MNYIFGTSRWHLVKSFVETTVPERTWTGKSGWYEKAGSYDCTFFYPAYRTRVASTFCGNKFFADNKSPSREKATRKKPSATRWIVSTVFRDWSERVSEPMCRNCAQESERQEASARQAATTE